MAYRALLLAGSVVSLVSAQATTSEGYGRFPCSSRNGDGTFSPDQNQCFNPITPRAGDNSGAQIDGKTPVDSTCARQFGGGFFCGIAGAACFSDENCDNGYCYSGSCQGGFGQFCDGNDQLCSGYLYCSGADFTPADTCGGLGTYCQDPGAPLGADAAEAQSIFNQLCQSGYCGESSGNCENRIPRGGSCEEQPFGCTSPDVCGANGICSALETTTTITESQGGQTLTFLSETTVGTSTITPVASTSTVFTPTTTTPVQVVSTTETAPPSTIIEFVDLVTTPTVLSTSPVTPDAVIVSTTVPNPLGPATTTVFSTLTPPTSFQVQSITVRSTPPVVTVTSTVAPNTRTVTQAVTVTSTPPSLTTTSVLASTTGSSACTEARLVYPAACCPNQYLTLNSQPRRRRGLVLGRALTTETVLVPPTFVTRTVLRTALTTLTAATNTITEPSFVQATETSTSFVTVSIPPSETSYSTSTRFTATAEASTSVIFETLAAPTSTSTVTLDRSTITEASVQTLATPRQRTRITTTILGAAQTSTQVVRARVLTVTEQTTTTVLGSAPVVTATSTSLSPVACATQLPAETNACGARLTTAKLTRKKAVTGSRDIIIDCGTAGTFYYY